MKKININHSIAQKLSAIAFPQWYKYYYYLQFKNALHIQHINRCDWVEYWTSVISGAKKRVLFALNWPFLDQDHSYGVLDMLKNASDHHILILAYIKTQIEQQPDKSFMTLFENSQQSFRASDVIVEQFPFYYAIIDDQLFLQAPSQPYHHDQVVYQKKISNNVIKNYMLNHHHFHINEELKTKFLLAVD